MSKNRKLSTDEFKFLYGYQVYATNNDQQQVQKLKLLDKAIKAYGDTYYNLKPATRKAIEMMCFFAAEKGYCFAKEAYFADRFGMSPRTVRNVFKTLRDSGVVYTIYRRSTQQNGLGSAIHLFVDHPYFKVWKDAFDLPEYQAKCQAEIVEKPCESKAEEPKKVPTLYLSFKKNLLKALRKENRLGLSYTPKNVPEPFVKAIEPFFDEASEAYSLWGKVLLAYKQFDLSNTIEEYVDIAVDAFKQTVFAHKHRKIKKDFKGYLYGTLIKMFTYQRRQETFENHSEIYNWLEEGPSESYSNKYADEKTAPSGTVDNLGYDPCNPRNAIYWDNPDELPF